jgi:hypothetical protein
MIGREELVTLETLARQQVSMYNDSCDIGIFETLDIRNRIRTALQGIKELEGGRTRYWGGQQENVSYTTFLAVEHDEGDDVGYLIDVSRVWHAKQRRHYYSIDITRATRTQYKLATGQRKTA